MKKLLCVLGMVVLCLSLAKVSFALFGSAPKINEKHIASDLIGREVQGWTFEKAALYRIRILDAKYDKDTAIVYVSVRTINKEGKSGREGKLRLEYEYAADDWNMLDMKPISFSKLEGYDVDKLKQIIGYPLFLAADEGDVATVQSLIGQGTDVNQKDNGGMTALMWAAIEGHLDVAKVLLAKGADVNAKNKAGWTALMAAALKGDTKTVEMLLTKGTDVNAKDEIGWTALFYAISAAKLPIVKALLDNGANVNLEDNYGLTPLTRANNQGHTDIVQLLRKAGAKE